MKYIKIILITIIGIIFLGIIIFKFRVWQGEKYLESQYNPILRQTKKIQNEGDLIIEYKESTPVYNESNQLENLNVKLQITAPNKTGDYLLDAYLSEPIVPSNRGTQLDSSKKLNFTLKQGEPYVLVIPFKMNKFVNNRYFGEFELSLGAWNTNLNIKNAEWDPKPISTIPVYLYSDKKNEGKEEYKTVDLHFKLNPVPIIKP